MVQAQSMIGPVLRRVAYEEPTYEYYFECYSTVLSRLDVFIRIGVVEIPGKEFHSFLETFLMYLGLVKKGTCEGAFLDTVVSELNQFVDRYFPGENWRDSYGA